VAFSGPKSSPDVEFSTPALGYSKNFNLQCRKRRILMKMDMNV
jgi:hypothetical protein